MLTLKASKATKTTTGIRASNSFNSLFVTIVSSLALLGFNVLTLHKIIILRWFLLDQTNSGHDFSYFSIARFPHCNLNQLKKTNQAGT